MKINHLIVFYLCVFMAIGHAKQSDLNIGYLEKRGLMFAPANVPCQVMLVGHFSLSVSDKEKSDIHYVVHHLGEASKKNNVKEKGYLATHGLQIREAGNRIQHVPVLQFLAVIFSDSKRKADMHAIHKKQHLPWDNMKTNVVQNLRNENAKGEIMPQLEGFCSHIGADYNRMREFAERGDWEGFLRALL